MRLFIPQSLQADIYATIGVAVAERGIVNVPVVAEEIRVRNVDENVALEDIERRVLEIAQLFRAPIEFDSAVQLDAAVALLPVAGIDAMPLVAAIVTIDRE